MKFRSDFVTNSSSSSYCITVGVILKDGSDLNYTFRAPQDDNGDMGRVIFYDDDFSWDYEDQEQPQFIFPNINHYFFHGSFKVIGFFHCSRTMTEAASSLITHASNSSSDNWDLAIC